MLIGLQGPTQANSKRVASGTGQLYSVSTVRSLSTETFEFVLERMAPILVQDFNGEGVDNQANDVSAAGIFAAVCGSTLLSSNNNQGRVMLFKEPLEVNFDLFNYRKGQFLDVGAPGFLANDAGWFGGVVTIAFPPMNGTLTLNPDNSFRYAPNVGFHGQDQFEYRVQLGSVTRTTSVILIPLAIGDIVIGTAEVTGGTNLTGDVQLTANTPEANLVVQMAENITGLAVTSSVAIPQGQFRGTFNIITVPVASDQTGFITARLDGKSVAVPFTVRRAVPELLTVDPHSLVAGQSFTGTVKMTGKAPAGGLVVNVTHSGVEITTPYVNTVAAGSDTVSFVGTTEPRSTTVTHLITATSGGVSKTANLTLNPGGLFAFTITPTTVRGGTSASGRVQTAGIAPPGGTVITMTKSGGSVSVPPTVTVPAGAQFKNFTMNTAPVTTTLVRTITATFGTVVKAQTLTLTP